MATGDRDARPGRTAAVETPQPRHPRQDGVCGCLTASGTADGRRLQPAGREWVSAPTAAADGDGREMAAGRSLHTRPGCAGAGSSRRGPPNAAEQAKEQGRGTVGPTTGDIFKRPKLIL